MVKRTAEYNEGPEASENFHRALTKIFSAPKKKTSSNPVKATARKKRGKQQG